MTSSTLGLYLALSLMSPAEPVHAQTVPTAAPAVPSVQEEVIALSRQKWLWMAERQMDELSDLFHEDAVFVHMGGSMGRTQELATIKSGGIQYKHADIQEISAVVVDATAVVLSRLRLTAVVGGNEVVNPFAVTEVYVRQGTSWKLVSLAFTRLLG